MSIGTTVIMCLSITACANRNNVLNNDPNRTNGNRTVTPITQRYTAPNSTQIGTFNNGVFTGEGNRNNNGNETAIVTIRNGLIDNIELVSVDISGNVRGNRITDTDTNRNIAVTPGPGITPGTATDAGTAGTNTGTVTGTGTTAGTLPGPAAITGNGTNAGNITGTITGTGTNAGTNNAAITASNLESAKRKLINNVINQQTADVNITVDESARATVDNWKVAIKRALDKASR